MTTNFRSNSSQFSPRYPAFLAISIPFVTLLNQEGERGVFVSAAGLFFYGLSVVAISYGTNWFMNDKPTTGDIEFPAEWGWNPAEGKCTWTKNGDGMVTLSGIAHSLNPPQKHNGPFAKLPENAFPIQNIYTVGMGVNRKYCRVYIHTNGNISIHDYEDSNNPSRWISLEGISYYAKDAKLQSML